MIDFAHFAAGQVFARRYAIVRLVKAGGMGAVYEATHLATKRRVALKVMRPEIVADPGERARFVQEAQVATLIESAHVVDVLDAGVDDDTQIPFLVMEYLVGEELGDLLKRRGRLAAVEAVHLLSQAARALDKAHQRGVVHRDLKPENMFVAVRDDAATLKILDFGIAKVLQSANSSSTRGSGTPLYMAPEQTRRSSQIGPATDIWALGLIAYKLVVGRPYWLAEDVHQLLGEILVEPLESATHRAAQAGVGLPPAFDPWFFSCVQRDPSSRYSSAGDAIAALGHVFGIDMPRPSIVSSPVRTPPTLHDVGSSPASPAMAAAATEPAVASPLALAETTASPQTRDPARPRGVPSRTPIYVGLGIVGVGVVVAAVVLFRDGGSSSAASTPTPRSSASSNASPSAAPKASADPKSFVEVDDPYVKLGKIEMQEHEVTREEYARYIVSLPEDERDEARPREDWHGEPVAPATKKRPVTWVTFERAENFCAAISARLPTSSEYTKALGGRKFPWGDAWPTGPEQAQLAIDLGDKSMLRDVETTPLDVTTTHVFDLGGNVQEWTTTPGESKGTRLVRGGSVTMVVADSQKGILTGWDKPTEEDAGKEAAPTFVAGSALGFRCVREAK